MPEKFWTSEELADYLKVSPQTIRAWIRDKKVKGMRFGRRWRIADEEVQRLIKEGIETERPSEQVGQ